MDHTILEPEFLGFEKDVAYDIVIIKMRKNALCQKWMTCIIS